MADIRINALATTASSTASDDFLALDGSANGTRKLNAFSPSFGGNATVGGTLTVSGASLIVGGSSASASAPQIAWSFSSQTGIFFPGGTVIGFTQGAAESARFSSGNLLLGTTTDGGQKLQVAGTAYVSGNTRIGDATGTKLLEIAGSNSASGQGAALAFLAGSTTFGYIGRASYVTSGSRNTNDVGYLADTGLGHYFYTNGGTLAMTLDSSQNTTAAGWVKAPSFQLSTDAQGTIISSSSNVMNIDAAAGDIRVRPKAGSDFIIGNSAALKLGNAYVGGAPTANGYVTLKDSNGDTVQVLVYKA